jgi:flagellar hook-basal body complex protein FliE
MSIPSVALTGANAVASTASSTPSNTKAAGQGGGGSFADALKGLVDSVDENASQANDAVVGMLNKTGDVHDAMIALQRAEMSLQLTVQIRNKIVQAYQDIMRMPV